MSWTCVLPSLLPHSEGNSAGRRNALKMFSRTGRTSSSTLPSTEGLVSSSYPNSTTYELFAKEPKNPLCGSHVEARDNDGLGVEGLDVSLTREPVDDPAEGSVDASVCCLVGEMVGFDVEDLVGSSLGRMNGDSIGTFVEPLLGAAVGALVRASVAASVGALVGTLLGQTKFQRVIGALVGSSLGALVAK